MTLAVEDREVAHRKPVRAGLERSGAPLRHEGLVADLCFGEGVDGHGKTVSPRRAEGGGELAV